MDSVPVCRIRPVWHLSPMTASLSSSGPAMMEVVDIHSFMPANTAKQSPITYPFRLRRPNLLRLTCFRRGGVSTSFHGGCSVLVMGCRCCVCAKFPCLRILLFDSVGLMY